MKKLLLIAVALLTLCTPSFSAVTTSYGSIILDLYEDTELGVNNLWVLEMTTNVELNFHLEYLNVYMDFDNAYNTLNTQYYSIGHNYTTSIPFVEYPVIRTNDPVPADTTFLFYLLPDTYYLPDYDDTYEAVIDSIPIRISTGSGSKMFRVVWSYLFCGIRPRTCLNSSLFFWSFSFEIFYQTTIA